ncbi:MAG: hypothetical protein R3C10_08060 [Pirellulales bacterium]
MAVVGLDHPLRARRAADRDRPHAGKIVFAGRWSKSSNIPSQTVGTPAASVARWLVINSRMSAGVGRGPGKTCTAPTIAPV